VIIYTFIMNFLKFLVKIIEESIIS